MPDSPNPTRFDAWFKFYPADWMGNGRLRKLSDETKAIILELMCYAHTNEPYGTVSNAASNAALIGRSERSLRTAISEAISAGVLHPMPHVDGFFPSLVRDRQKCLAGVASAAVRNGRSKKRSEPQGSGLRAQGTQDTLKVPTEPPAPTARAPSKARRGGNDLTRLWDECWSELRMGTAYAWTQADAVQMAAAAKLAKGDVQELARRIRALLGSTDRWKAENATPRVLVSQWNSLTVEVKPLSKSDKAMQALQESVQFARDAYANDPKPAPRI